MDLNQQIKEIKQSFRLMMDGMVAASMRNKGANYKLNWGATLPRLRDKAEELKQMFNVSCLMFNQYDLAIALWKENVRECKILATMLMPADKMLPEVVDIWMEQTDSQEIAEQASFNLYQYLPYAADKAYTWMASDKELYQLCGFHILSRLFMNKQEPNERGINEFIDQALAALEGDSLMVKKAAMNAMIRFAELGLVYERLAKSALKRANLEFF
ncbi:peptidase [Xylanibacter ruminicola]|nr:MULTISPECIES: DNA alkylation repair protein [Prevotellaceae]GJG33409.1 peptidase [Xylanibacter ruminicola]SEI01436.1 DNA alkylation repair enzyme [Xylanibacter ruminicola]